MEEILDYEEDGKVYYREYAGFWERFAAALIDGFLVFFAVFSVKKVGILDLFWLAACRRRFFLAKYDGFCGKMTFLRFIRDVNNPIGSLSSIFWLY